MGKVIVIGGGAAGILAAISAAGRGDEVIILEHTKALGKKLLSTGNGRCNLTNKKQDDSFYRTENPGFPIPALTRFGYRETINFFNSLGLYCKERDGYVYPRSSQAAAVRNLLLEELFRLGVEIRTECEVRKLQRKTKGFLVLAADTSFYGDSVILACGGKSAPVTGSDGSGYGLAEALGHRLIPPVPALTGLRAAENPLKKAAGVRTDGRVSLYIKENGKERLVGSDAGELQLTDYGISGIPVFQVSRFASRALEQGMGVTARLNFLPEYDRDEAEELLETVLQRTEEDCFSLLLGLFPEKLAAVLLKKAGLPVHIPAGRLSGRQKQAIVDTVCRLRLSISAVNDFSQAQVTAGGIDTRDVNEETMESRLVPGLYFAGEMLDVDGICGGYNLQWAWASGFLAGKQGRP